MNRCIAFIFTALFSFFIFETNAQAGKYDGSWTFKIRTLVGGQCSTGPGKVVVKNGRIKGKLVSEGKAFSIYGEIRDNGQFKGKVGGGLADYTGSIKNGVGSGKWTNRFGCSGVMSFAKSGRSVSAKPSRTSSNRTVRKGEHSQKHYRCLNAGWSSGNAIWAKNNC